jgi:hypothetical protein
MAVCAASRAAVPALTESVGASPTESTPRLPLEMLRVVVRFSGEDADEDKENDDVVGAMSNTADAE